MIKIDLDDLGNILSGAWLQVEDELKGIEIANPDDKYPRVRFFQLVENEMIKQGLAECKDKRCQANHKEGIGRKYLL